MTLPVEMQSRNEREGVVSATLAGEARGVAEDIINNPFANWDDFRKLTPIFMNPMSVSICLQGINVYEQMGVRPLLAPNYVSFFKDTFYQELQARAQHGKSNISTIGWIRGVKHSEGRSWHRISSGNSYLIQGFKGGMDATWYGNRGIGKTDACLHYYAVPYLNEGNYVVSGVKIANNKDWPNYIYCPTNADLLLESVKLVIKHLKAGLPIPNIMVIRDDISASGVSRKRAGSEQLVNLEALGMVSRHYGMATVWIFQYMIHIPTSIREATTRWVRKTALKSLVSTIEWPNNIEVTKVGGLKGLADRKLETMDYLDYDTQNPQITVDNLPMNDIMMYVNFLDRAKDLNKLQRFEATRDYIDKMLRLSSQDRKMTQADALRSIVWMYIYGKKVKGLKNVPMTIAGLANMSGLPPGKVRYGVEKGLQDFKDNPDRWTPLLENRNAQRDIMNDALNL